MKQDTCHYCDTPLTKAYERDHFPVPERHGGTDLVKACIPCHDLKDRFNFKKWPPELIRNIDRDFATVATHFGLHLSLIKEFANGEIADVWLLQEFANVWPEFELMRVTHWPSLGREARIMIAKLSCLLQDIEKGRLQ